MLLNIRFSAGETYGYVLDDVFIYRQESGCIYRVSKVYTLRDVTPVRFDAMCLVQVL